MPTQMKFNTENSEFINDKKCSYERLRTSHSLTELLQSLRDLCNVTIHTKQYSSVQHTTSHCISSTL